MIDPWRDKPMKDRPEEERKFSWKNPVDRKIILVIVIAAAVLIAAVVLLLILGLPLLKGE